MTIRDMLNNEDLVNSIVEDISEIPDDVSVSYEVWAIGYDKDDNVTDAEMLLGTFEDPDCAISHAKAITLADVVDLAEDGEYTDLEEPIQYISIEVETVIPDEEGTMNIGTVYRKQIEIFEELPEYVTLSEDEYELLEDGNIQIPCSILKNYNKNDYITVIFEDENTSQPIVYRIICKTTSGHYICEFV